MAVCRKLPYEIGIAILGLTLVVTTTLLTTIGLGRYYFDLEDDSFNNRNHYILSGNVLSVFALGVTLFVLFDSGDQGALGVVLMMTMLFSMIIVLYLTNYDPSDKTSAMIAIVLSMIDMYVKVSAILIGYGTCNTGDLITGLSGVGKTMLGGRRR